MKNDINYFSCFLSQDDMQCMLILWWKGLLRDIIVVRNFPYRGRSILSKVLEVVGVYFISFFCLLTKRNFRVFYYCNERNNYEVNKEGHSQNHLLGIYEHMILNTVCELSSSFYRDDPEWNAHYKTASMNLLRFLEFLGSEYDSKMVGTFNGRNMFAQVIKVKYQKMIIAERQSYNLKRRLYWTRLLPCSMDVMVTLAENRLGKLLDDPEFNWRNFYLDRANARDREGKRFVSKQKLVNYHKSDVVAFSSNLFESVGIELDIEDAHRIENSFFCAIEHELKEGKSVTLRMHPYSTRLSKFSKNRLRDSLAPLLMYSKFTLIDANSDCYVYGLFEEGQTVITMGSTLAVEANFHSRNLTIIDENPAGIYNTLIRRTKLNRFDREAILRLSAIILTGHAVR